MAFLSGVSAAAAATNLSQIAGPPGCLTETGLGLECGDGRGLVGSTSIVLSPDGANAYVASDTYDSVATLSRQADGSLAQAPSASSCFDSLEITYADCVDARELGGANDVAISADGQSVYVSSGDDSALVVFDRAPASGALSLSGASDGCFNEDGSDSCVAARGLESAVAVAVSPDDENVYLAAEGLDGGIAVFDRDSQTGDLIQKAGSAGCLNASGNDGCAEGPGDLLGARSIEVSGDGRFVYVASGARDALTVLSRDLSTGQLTGVAGPAGCVKEGGADGCTVATGLGDPTAIAFDPGEETAYVASERRDAILVFDRDPATGALTQKPGRSGCLSDTGLSDPLNAGTAGNCADGMALDGVSSVAASPDGTAVYATAAHSDGIAVLERLADGEIAQRPGTAGCITETGYENAVLPWTEGYCEDGRALLEARSIVTSSDSRFVYAAARMGGVSSLEVVPAPGSERPAEMTPAETRSTATRGCSKARRERKRADRTLAGARRTLRRASRRALLARTRAARIRRARLVKRLRHRVAGLRKERRHIARRARRVCP